ncbi:MAG: site-specific DNA-methyltransferase, partial [Thermodesulfobacteriota bacterium]
MDGKSLDIKEEKLNKLKSIIPEAFCENKIDWEKLKAALGEDMEFKNERYVLNWAGKSDAFRVLQSPTTATLVPAKDESVNFDTTENIFIEGENLEVLKVLQKSYFGKIKMIYIDPPYNTGNDTFIYPDKFSETKEEYLSRIGDKDETGYLTREGLFRKNSKDSGYYHSNWLSMMYPRLFLARNLLRDDGVIFVSIDDNEVHNLRLLMNEVFGEENFVGVFCVNSTPNARDYGHIGKMHEYVLFFTKNNVEAATNLIPEVDRKFKYSDEKGGYNIHPLYNSNVAFHSKNRPNLFYPLYLYPDKAIDDDFFEIGLENKISSIEVFPPLSKEGVQFVWRWSKDKVKTNLNREILGYRTGSGEFRVVQKMRHSAKLIRSLLTGKEYSTRRGTAEVEQLFGSKIFSFPKPLELLKEFIISGMAEEDLILDLFAGSATTAHAILDLNKEDGGNRKFIMVQLPEPTSPPVKGDKGGSEAYKAGYKTIAEIGKERIRRVIKTLSPSPSPLTGKGEKEEKEPNLFASSEVLSKGGVF